MNRFTHCFEKIKKDYFSFCKKEEIKGEKFHNKKKMLISFLITLSYWIIKRKKQNKKILFLGLSGGQGSGKTTITAILKIILTKYFKRKVCVISVDDFYKTLKERNRLSKTKHHLLKIRGVPGTHDIHLIFNFLKILKKKRFTSTIIPKFDKSIDDRFIKSKWLKLNKKPDIVILEGWCVGAKAQSYNLLKKHVNDLEKFEDPKLIWRKFVNQNLQQSYKKLFSEMDEIIYLKVPSFSMLKIWRIKQEKKLQYKSRFRKNVKTMSRSQVLRFMMFYQRVTLQMFKDMPKIASVVLILNKKHQINKIRFKN